MKYLKAALFVILLAPVVAQAKLFDISSYENTNNLIWDKSFQKHISAFFGKKTAVYLYYGLVSEQVSDGLGGPPDNIVQIAPNTYLATACRQHYCPEKSAYITDGKHEMFALIAFQEGTSRKNKASLPNGRLFIFYKDKEPAAELSEPLITWANGIDAKIDVKFIKVNAKIQPL